VFPPHRCGLGPLLLARSAAGQPGILTPPFALQQNAHAQSTPPKHENPRGARVQESRTTGFEPATFRLEARKRGSLHRYSGFLAALRAPQFRYESPNWEYGWNTRPSNKHGVCRRRGAAPDQWIPPLAGQQSSEGLPRRPTHGSALSPTRSRARRCWDEQSRRQRPCHLRSTRTARCCVGFSTRGSLG
jgi:hypothetical protein